MCVWLEEWKTFLFGWREKGEHGKCSLYKLTIMSLLYNSGKVRGVGECKKWGICVKCISHHFSLLIFLPIWEDKKSGPRREKFLPYFLSLLFSFLNQTVENNILHPIFLSLFSILPIFTPTKHNLSVFVYPIIFFHSPIDDKDFFDKNLKG